MLFMGEEWCATSPFPFFCDIGPELADAVRNGRRAEFAKFPEFGDPAARERIPDPQAEATFLSAKLVWNEHGHAGHCEWLDWYRRILLCRRELIAGLSDQIEHGGVFGIIGQSAVLVRWSLRGDRELRLAVNLSDAAVSGFPVRAEDVIWEEGLSTDEGRTLHPWCVRWWIVDRE
jgi:1,4-alpha-glucan branching enzyme